METQPDSSNKAAAPAMIPHGSSDASSLNDFLPDVVCTLDGAGRFVQVSAAARTLWGYEPAVLAGRYVLELVVPEDRERTRFIAESVRSGNELHDFLNYVRCSDGSRKPVIWSARWHAEQAIFYCIARDGSLRLQHERSNQQYQQRLYRAYRLAQLGWWEWDSKTGLLTLSDELYELYGLNKAQYPQGFTTEGFLSLVHPDDLDAVLEHWELVPQATTYQYGCRIITVRGETIYVQQHIQTLRDAEGNVTGVHGTTQDTTLSETARRALETSQKRLQTIVESLGDGFYQVDRNWTVTYWNKKIEQITGVKREDMLGHSLWERFPEASVRKFYSEYSRALAEHLPVSFEEYSPSLQAWVEMNVYPSEEGLSVFVKDITEQKRHHEERRRLDKKLQKSNDNLQHVLESMSDGFFILDRHWTITFANDRVLGMIDVSREEVVGRNVWEWLPLSIHSKFYSGYHKAFAENTFVSVEDFLPHFNMWFEANAYPYNDELLVFVRNIDERKRQEQELRISNERFQFVSMATSDVTWDWNVATGELYINQSFTKVFGYELSQHSPSHQLWESNLHPDDKDRVMASQAEALGNKNIFLWEDSYRFIKRCGETAYVTDRAVIIRNPEGVALRMVGAVQDITEQRKQQRRLEFMARATSEVIWERPIDSEQVVINGERFSQLFGHAVQGNRIHRSYWLDKIHPDDTALIQANREQALRQELDHYVNEYRLRRANGSWAIVKDRTYIVRNEQGRVVSLVGAIEDITGERLAEQALVESEQSYRQLFDNAPLPTIISDAATLRILDVNSEAVEQYGYSREEFLSMTILDIHTPEEQPRVLSDARSLRPDTRNTIGAIANLKKGGAKMLVEVSVTTTHYKGKAANLATIKDVTEKVRLQEALTQQKINQQKSITKAIIEAQESERSAIGRELHDNVNQILASAKLYVENIQHYPGQHERFIERGTSLLNKSIEEIRRLSRELVTPTLRDIGFCDTVLELADSYGDLGLFEVVCSFHCEEQALDPELKLTLYRILQEALNNTVKYAHATLVHITLEHHKGVLHLAYRDNGTGFDPTLVKKGIGLNNIRNRAEAYRGKVSLASAPGRGCRLDIVFPQER